MTVANVNVTKVLFKRGNTVQNNNYTGVSGEITIDTQAKTLRIHDGSTVGGNIITATLTGNAGSQQAAIDSLNANVGAYQIYGNANAATQTVSINAINANLGAFQTFSNANAAAQATSINSINANLGAFQSYANITLSTIANAASQESAINSINANVGAYQMYANSNAASQTTEINSLRANITAANSAITSLTSNAAIQAALLDTLTGNAATQSTVLDTLTANAATQATTLTTLLSNAVAQQSSLIDLVANAATQAQAIANVTGTYSNTNVAAYLGAFDGNILPSANVTYSLGDSTHQWKDLWVSNNTIYIGNTPIRVDSGTLLVNGAPVATTVSNLVNGAYTFNLFANGQSRSPDTVFASNGVSIINANGAIQGGIYNSGDANFFNIGASTGRGIKFYVDEENAGPLFFANGSVNVPGNLYSTAGIIGDVNIYGGTIYGTNPSWNYLTLANQGEGSVFVQLPSEATANVANLRIHNDIGNVEIATGDGASYNYWYFGNNGDLTVPRDIFGTGTNPLVIQNTSTGSAYLELPLTPGTNPVYLSNQDPAGNVVVRTGDFGSENDWTFGMDGNLTIPGNITMGPGSGRLISVVTPEPGLVSWEFGMDGNLTIPGNIINTGTYGQINFVANSSGDGYGLSTIQLVPYTAGYDSAIIIIDPTYPNHIHMRAGFEQDNAAANLFLGGEASHFNVEEGANPNVSIRSNYYTWKFATDGRLQLPELGESSSEIFTGSGGISIKSPQYTELRYSSTDPGNVSPTLNTEGYIWITDDGAHIQNYHGGQFNLGWLFGTDGNLTFPTGGSLTFDSSAVSTIDGVTNINAVGTVGANVIQVLSDLTSFGASPAPVIYGFRSIATTGSAVNEGNISASGNLVASQNAYVTGNVFAARYNFANGVNILSTVGAGSYGNTEVAAYLPTYSGNSGAARVQVTNALDFMYGGYPYMGWQLSGSDTLKLRTNIASGDYTDDAIIVDRQSLAVNVVATLTAGNIITANGLFWSNGVAYSTGGAASTGNITFSDTTISTSGGAGQGIILNSAGAGEIAMLDYVGINNTNPGYWLHVGDGAPGAVNNTGNISIDYNNGLDSSRASTIIGYAWWDSGGNGNNNRGIGAHRQFGIYKNDDLYTTKYLEIDLTSGNANLTNIAVTRVTTTNGVFWANGSVYTSSDLVLNANIGAYQTYANANASSQQTSIDSINANIGAYQTYANANASTQSTAIDAKAPLTAPTFSGTVTSGGNIVAQSNVTVNNNLSVLGNLLVQGTTTTINSTTLSITDKFITVANSSTNNSEANGAGIYVPGSSANILYTSVDDSWTLNKTIVGTANIKAASWIIGGVFAYANGVNILADVNSNAATQATSINSINANIGSYQIFANANAATQATSINTINANLGSYQAYANATFSVSTYSNTNVAAYLTSYTGNIAANHVIVSNTISAVSITTSGTGGNITGANVISANTFVFAANGVNILTAASGIGTDDVLRANVGAYQLFANANAATQATSINTINANVGAYQIFANANAATQATSINTINANLGAYQTFANANVSSIQNQIFASNANIGAFQTYANATFGVSSYGNTQVAAYLLTYPNTNVATLNTTSGNIVTLRTANFNSANAVISGGYISALTNASIISATVTTINSTSGNVTTLAATNLSTANAVVTGGYASGLANISVTGNATVGNLIGSTANTTIIAGAYSSTFDNVGNVVLPNLYVSGNTTTMGIASGYAPNRPAFRVYGSGNTGPLNTSVNGNGYLNGWNFAVDYNQGSYLNTTGANNSTTAGFFTAPVTGLYQICVNARNAGNLSTISQLICYKNPTTTAAVQTMLEFGSNSSMNHAGVSTVSRLTAGDTLALKVTAGTINFDGNDNWSVTYIG